jgi:hypothetical protein
VSAAELWFCAIQLTIVKNSFSYQVRFRGTVARWCRDNALDIHPGRTSFKSWPDTGYLDWGFSCFYQSLQVYVGIILLLGHDRFLPNSFQFIFYQLFYYRWYKVWNTGNFIRWITNKNYSVTSKKGFIFLFCQWRGLQIADSLRLFGLGSAKLRFYHVSQMEILVRIMFKQRNTYHPSFQQDLSLVINIFHFS